jgi:hypothetical protein
MPSGEADMQQLQLLFCFKNKEILKRIDSFFMKRLLINN